MTNQKKRNARNASKTGKSKPVGVICNMRLEYGTLDHLPPATFRRDVLLARECEKANPGYLRSVAESYGEDRLFDQWEKENEERQSKEKLIYRPNSRGVKAVTN